MASAPDLDQRLRSAAEPEPDTERALADVVRRIRRRTRRRVVAAVATVAVAGGLVAAWVIERPGSEEPSVFIERPPTTTTPGPGDAVGRLHELWTASGVGMSACCPAQAGQLIVPAGDAVYAANGFGTDGTAAETGRCPGCTGHITALDRATGDVRWSTELGEDAWLQGVTGDTVIANTQRDRIVGLDATEGTVRWEISLPEVGLDGYGAVRSAVVAPRSAIGLSVWNPVDDSRPPVVLGVDTGTGNVAWTTTLVEESALSWGTPPVHDGETVFLTSSPPASESSTGGLAAEGNWAHLIELADGHVRWAVDLGGRQGLGIETSAVIDGSHIQLPTHPDLVTVDRNDGRRLWARPGSTFVTTTEGVWWDRGSHLALLDAGTGEVVRELDSPVAQPVQLLDLGNGRIGVVGRTEFAALDANGEVEVLDTLPSELSRRARWDDGMLLAATWDQAVTAYALEPPS
jgi:outer membrane protein assembly factor BamB